MPPGRSKPTWSCRSTKSTPVATPLADVQAFPETAPADTQSKPTPRRSTRAAAQRAKAAAQVTGACGTTSGVTARTTPNVAPVATSVATPNVAPVVTSFVTPNGSLKVTPKGKSNGMPDGTTNGTDTAVISLTGPVFDIKEDESPLGKPGVHLDGTISGITQDAVGGSLGEAIRIKQDDRAAAAVDAQVGRKVFGERASIGNTTEIKDDEDSCAGGAAQMMQQGFVCENEDVVELISDGEDQGVMAAPSDGVAGQGMEAFKAHNGQMPGKVKEEGTPPKPNHTSFAAAVAHPSLASHSTLSGTLTAGTEPITAGIAPTTTRTPAAAASAGTFSSRQHRSSSPPAGSRASAGAATPATTAGTPGTGTPGTAANSAVTIAAAAAAGPSSSSQSRSRLPCRPRRAASKNASVLAGKGAASQQEGEQGSEPDWADGETDAGRNGEREDEDDMEEDYDLEAESEMEEAGEQGMWHPEPVSRDFGRLELKPDHVNRPLWVTPDGRIFLETYSPIYKQAYDFLIAIAEPMCRPENVHEYQLTPHSLYAAVSIGLETGTIVSVLNRLSKVKLPEDMERFIQSSTQNYGKVKLVLKRNRFYVESHDANILKELLKDPVIAKAKVGDTEEADSFVVSKALRERAGAEIARQVREAEEKMERVAQEGEGEQAREGLAGREQEDTGQGPQRKQEREEEGAEVPGGFEEPEELEEEVHAFEVDPDQVEHVKQRCLPGGLNYPMLEEYDFRNDTLNEDLAADLKPHVRLRPYQEKSLSKMFGNGRARSGIIVLPCGAGKSLVGVAAALRVKKSCLCLCTSSVSVDQWRHQFKLWTSLQDHQIARFTSENKADFTGAAGVLVTTFTMIAFSGKRNEESEKVMREIRGREWGLLLLDEVHVVPAAMFRKVISIVKAHCKLGLTATLVREDQRIGDLDFLIGPKLYEANWLDLTRAGHIANVQCAEVWCPMTKEFFREYLKPPNAAKKQLMYIMNPNKIMACQFLIEFHERVRGDKIIVFSDNIFALKEYAMRFHKPFIYGPTSHAERTRILHAFKHSPDVNTIFLSKVGDNSLDIPEANVLIQISSHAGSRRQEAQRLGRILRAKRGRPGSGQEEEYNAFFYTLVSKDTQEMYYSSKRQQFLIDQGYSFKVVTNLLDAAGGSGMHLHCSSYDEQLNLLARVLAASEDEAGEEVLDHEDDDLVKNSGRTAIRRTVGSMSALSGAQGMMYLEYRTGDKRPQGQMGYQSSAAKRMAKNLFAK